MKAIGFNRYGTPDVLEVLDAHAADPGPGEVLVRVRACGLNPVDTKIRRGMLPMPFAFPVVPGYDVSGVVEAVGPEVADFQPGDEVFYSPELLPPGWYAYTLVNFRIVSATGFGSLWFSRKDRPNHGTRVVRACAMKNPPAGNVPL